jgi:hypothetical protein
MVKGTSGNLGRSSALAFRCHFPPDFRQVFENTCLKSDEKWRENPLRLAHPGFQRCPKLKILKVVDKQKFADALYAWTRKFDWKNDFPERNRNFLARFQGAE